jgi:hypothetical protein
MNQSILEQLIQMIASGIVGGFISTLIYHYYKKAQQRIFLKKILKMSKPHQKVHELKLVIKEIAAVLEELDEDTTF